MSVLRNHVASSDSAKAILCLFRLSFGCVPCVLFAIVCCTSMAVIAREWVGEEWWRWYLLSQRLEAVYDGDLCFEVSLLNNLALRSLWRSLVLFLTLRLARSCGVLCRNLSSRSLGMSDVGRQTDWREKALAYLPRCSLWRLRWALSITQQKAQQSFFRSPVQSSAADPVLLSR